MDSATVVRPSHEVLQPLPDAGETVSKVFTSHEWFREPGGQCIDCRDHFSPRAVL
jgi:hypothetical protein